MIVMIDVDYNDNIDISILTLIESQLLTIIKMLHMDMMLDIIFEFDKKKIEFDQGFLKQIN